MTSAPRSFLLGPDDTLYRLPSAKFSQMLDEPASHRLDRFADQRVRMVEAIVAVHERAPRAVVRVVYEMLRFDAEGQLDRPASFTRQNAALADLAVDRGLGRSSPPGEPVVEASPLFIAPR